MEGLKENVVPQKGCYEIVKYLPEDLEKNLPTEEDINLHIDIKE